jgi:hypothetical protein
MRQNPSNVDRSFEVEARDIQELSCVSERLLWVISGMWHRLLDFQLCNLISSIERLRSDRMGPKMKRES